MFNWVFCTNFVCVHTNAWLIIIVCSRKICDNIVSQEVQTVRIKFGKFTANACTGTKIQIQASKKEISDLQQLKVKCSDTLLESLEEHVLLSICFDFSFVATMTLGEWMMCQESNGMEPE